MPRTTVKIPFNEKLMKYANFNIQQREYYGEEDMICLVCAEWCNANYRLLHGFWNDINADDIEDYSEVQSALCICYNCYNIYDYLDQDKINILGRPFIIECTTKGSA